MTEPHIQRIYDGQDGPCSPADAVRPYLRSGETLVWADRPAPLHLGPGLFWLLAFSLFTLVYGGFCLGFGLLDLIGESRFADWVRLLQGLLFITMGLVFLSGRVFPAFHSAWTVYAITDQRAIIIRHMMRRRATSFEPEHLDEPLRLDRDEGYGHLIFAKRRKNLLLQDKDRSRYVGIGFFRVREVAKVEAELLKLRARATVSAETSDLVAQPS